MERPTSVLVVGIGGYGENHVNELLDSERKDYRLVGMVDPYPENSSRIQEIRERGIPVYPTMEEFYKKDTADYVIISSPIHFHCEQVIMALNNGGAVLCEKPLAATVQEGREMLRVQQETGKPVGIAYQWSYSKAIQDLKKDILAGLFGKPIRMKTMVIWPRDFNYYKRNNWAGKLKVDGKWILDSVASNATAHYLHNMFYLLGSVIENSAYPASLQAELYRANNIENYDTAAVRIFTEEKVELLYFVTHAADEELNPSFTYEFEEGIIYFNADSDNQIMAHFKDGSKKNYGNPFAGDFDKIWVMLDVVKGKGSYLCGIEAALPHVIAINGIQEAVPEIANFPSEMIKYIIDSSGNHRAVYVEGLVQLFKDCYNKWSLPHELENRWTITPGEIELTGYRGEEYA